MTKLQPFQVAVPTAFNADESLNVDATIAHIRYLAHHGVDSVLVSGSTGEQHSMTLTEKQTLAAALEHAELPPALEIIFGVASIRQHEAVALAATVAQQHRINGILLASRRTFSPRNRRPAITFRPSSPRRSARPSSTTIPTVLASTWS